MGVNVGFNFSSFDNKFSDSNLLHGRLAAINDAHQAMEQFVPKRSGDLREYSVIKSDGTGIIYTMPYARAQFYGEVNGHPIKNYSTPGTSSHWDRRLAGDRQLVSQIKEAFVKGANWNGS